jgi:hypothetical protein
MTSGGQRHKPLLNFRSVAIIAIIIGLILAYGPGYLKEKEEEINITVAAENLTAYHLLKAGDLANKSIEKSQVPTGAIYDYSTYIGGQYFTLESFIKNDTVPMDKIVKLSDQNSLQDSIIIGIDTTNAMALGGEFKAGEKADLIIVGNEKPSTIDEVTVLAVKDNPINNSTYGYVVVLAIPKEGISHLSGDYKTFIAKKTLT